MILNRKLLEFLVCPRTKTGLRYDSHNQELISDRAKLAYIIDNGVPMMQIDNARTLDKKDVKK
jgi:uncharacterized protein